MHNLWSSENRHRNLMDLLLLGLVSKDVVDDSSVRVYKVEAVSAIFVQRTGITGSTAD